MGHDASPRARWLLAFDASCATCRQVSATVGQVCGDRLEVMPLAHPDVRRWRDRALGPDAPWAPTLLRITDDRARAWTTGPLMGLRLALRLGPRSVIRVLDALGTLTPATPATPATPDAPAAAAQTPDSDSQHHAQPVSGSRGTTLGRAQFLRLAAGLGAAAGLVLAGRTPAFAVPRSTATHWAQANKDRLPRTYDELIAYPVDYRRAVYGESAPETRSRFWIEHLDRYRTAHPVLSAQQRGVLDQASLLAADVSTFAAGRAEQGDHRQRLTKLGDDAVEAFGEHEAAALLALLGPAGDVDTEVSRALPRDAGVPGCECGYGFVGSCPDRCWGCFTCGNPEADSWGICGVYSPGCGPLWQFACNGRCDRTSCHSC